MNIKHLKAVPVALFMAFGGSHAVASNGWFYDESSDSIVFTVEGSRGAIASPSSALPRNVEPDRSWYHEELRDTIVFNVEGSRSQYGPSNSPSNTNTPNRSWYYDELRDTIVFNVEGSRDKHREM